MRQTIRNLAAASLLAALALAPVSADATGPVNILILKEHGVGSASSAQTYVDKLVSHVARQNGWEGAAGKYVTSRSTAASYIRESDPHFGILSLGAFLDLRGKHELEVLGSAEVVGGGGRQYFLVSSTQAAAADCKGKSLGTDHGDDRRFIDAVVSGDAFDLSDFQVVDTKRPMKTVNAVVRGEVECALIDDAQKAAMPKVDGGGAVQVLWSSKELPPMVVVAFPSAPAAERKSFQSKLGSVCSGDGASACKEVGLAALEKADASRYAEVTKLY